MKGKENTFRVAPPGLGRGFLKRQAPLLVTAAASSVTGLLLWAQVLPLLSADKARFGLVGVILGLLLAAAATLREANRQHFLDAQELADHTGLPVMAVLPDIHS